MDIFPDSVVDSVRRSGSCPECGDAVRDVPCAVGDSDCFTVECPDYESCGFYESNCHVGC